MKAALLLFCFVILTSFQEKGLFLAYGSLERENIPQKWDSPESKETMRFFYNQNLQDQELCDNILGKMNLVILAYQELGKIVLSTVEIGKEPVEHELLAHKLWEITDIRTALIQEYANVKLNNDFFIQKELVDGNEEKDCNDLLKYFKDFHELLQDFIPLYCEAEAGYREISDLYRNRMDEEKIEVLEKTDYRIHILESKRGEEKSDYLSQLESEVFLEHKIAEETLAMPKWEILNTIFYGYLNYSLKTKQLIDQIWNTRVGYFLLGNLCELLSSFPKKFCVEIIEGNEFQFHRFPEKKGGIYVVKIEIGKEKKEVTRACLALGEDMENIKKLYIYTLPIPHFIALAHELIHFLLRTYCIKKNESTNFLDCLVDNTKDTRRIWEELFERTLFPDFLDEESKNEVHKWLGKPFYTGESVRGESIAVHQSDLNLKTAPVSLYMDYYDGQRSQDEHVVLWGFIPSSHKYLKIWIGESQLLSEHFRRPILPFFNRPLKSIKSSLNRPFYDIQAIFSSINERKQACPRIFSELKYIPEKKEENIYYIDYLSRLKKLTAIQLEDLQEKGSSLEGKGSLFGKFILPGVSINSQKMKMLTDIQETIDEEWKIYELDWASPENFVQSDCEIERIENFLVEHQLKLQDVPLTKDSAILAVMQANDMLIPDEDESNMEFMQTVRKTSAMIALHKGDRKSATRLKTTVAEKVRRKTATQAPNNLPRVWIETTDFQYIAKAMEIPIGIAVTTFQGAFEFMAYSSEGQPIDIATENEGFIAQFKEQYPNGVLIYCNSGGHYQAIVQK